MILYSKNRIINLSAVKEFNISVRDYPYHAFILSFDDEKVKIPFTSVHTGDPKKIMTFFLSDRERVMEKYASFIHEKMHEEEVSTFERFLGEFVKKLTEE